MHGIKEATEQLEQHAMKCIEREYGVNSKSPKPYHNIEHTSTVVQSSRLLAEVISLSQRDRLLLTIAAAFHDIVHAGDSDPDNERLSADEAGKTMTEFSVFTKADISRVKQMILATKCSVKYPKIVQSPQVDDICSKIVCDADLSSFGKPYDEFLKSTDYYFEELYPGSNKNTDQYTKFLEAEVVILKNHDFWTNEASDIFPHKQENIRKLIEHIK